MTGTATCFLTVKIKAGYGVQLLDSVVFYLTGTTVDWHHLVLVMDLRQMFWEIIVENMVKNDD